MPMNPNMPINATARVSETQDNLHFQASLLRLFSHLKPATNPSHDENLARQVEELAAQIR